MGKRLTRIDLTYVSMLAFESKVLGRTVFASVHGIKQDGTGKFILILFDGDDTFDVSEDELLESATALTDNDLLRCINEIFRFFSKIEKSNAGTE